MAPSLWEGKPYRQSAPTDMSIMVLVSRPDFIGPFSCYNLSMNEDILKRLDEQDKKLTAVLESSEKMRKYFLWTLIISVAVIILPMIGMVFVLPSFFDSLALPAGF